jgi:septal ring factor EnvC (AmiA/AmiB activator)|tara:strand:- start:340 stop:573 length:234 start_codon:yes stop_codon:yes gene_type:complete
MNIDEKTLQSERDTLKKDFEAVQNKIKETENVLAQLKNNLNAVYGAIQQTDKMLKLLNEDDKKITAEKAQALNVATS